MHRCFRKTPFWGNCRGVSAEGPEAGSLANREAVSENRAEWDPGHIVQGLSLIHISEPTRQAS